MRELKILAVVVALTLITYWGVEPFAHSQMHPHVAPADFAFSDLKESVAPVKDLKGNATNGETMYAHFGESIMFVSFSSVMSL